MLPTPIIVAIVIFLVICILSAMGYVKAPTDEVVIISGLRKEPKIITGRSSVKWPFLQRIDRLSLKMLSVDVKTSKTIPTLDYINIMVDSVATVKISLQDEMIRHAAENFLNKDSKYINDMVVNVLEGNLREIIGSMKLVDIMNDRKTFATKVQENAAVDMAKMGLEIVSFNIQNIDDAGLGVIENLGIANTVAIRQNAEISRANAEKEIAVAQALAKQEANDARVTSETVIATKNNELQIKQADLKVQADTKKAEADAAYEIQKQEQMKTIEIKTADALIAKQEKEVQIKEQEAAVQEQQLNASIRKQADAERYRLQQLAEAQRFQTQQAADADKYKRIAEAEARLAEKQKEAEAVRVAGEAEAAATKAKGLAEAEAIKAKGEAEAAAMDKKAEALKKYGQAAMTQMVVEKLPEMAKAIAEPLAAIDKVTIIDSGNGESGVGSMGGYVPGVLAKTIESVRETTGFDLTDVMKANTYEAKTDRNVKLDADKAVINVENKNV
ncbi:flotillin family protein [Butyrivibrio fibrisolvens]|uniref:Flotillin n=1 Tax=Butyrivibrio fibrisolvens TaxID=831 RepID=A0A1H9VBY9_BUTFI|nr:flotillin family protein [Butyrivibrio fibrisolvens]MBQ1458076.1 flotillin family protein [Butyrivibrio sp.]SES19202.1 flotillin [Butyrivibrio fibrisolvens]